MQAFKSWKQQLKRIQKVGLYRSPKTERFCTVRRALEGLDLVNPMSAARGGNDRQVP
jgi:hypothetical protein